MIFRASLPFRYLSNVGKVNSKVPLVPQEIPNCTQKETVQVTQETVDHLERISLVDLGNIKGLKRLTSAIGFANQITGVGTINVEPLISVLENRSLFLREDCVAEGDCREEIMANATFKKEDYFVAPPGNIPLNPRKRMVEGDIERI